MGCGNVPIAMSPFYDIAVSCVLMRTTIELLPRPHPVSDFYFFA